MNEAGYLVRITHYRITKNGSLVLTYNNSRSYNKYGTKPDYSPYGGRTVVYIGMIAEPFVAECSKKDHFCFKDGTYLAVSRAYTYFKEHLVENPQGVAIQQEVPESKSCCGGSFCEAIKEVDEGTFQTVYKEENKYLIVCIDPTTEEFIGYLPKDDAYVTGKYEWEWATIPFISEEYCKDFYTKDVLEAAEFDTKDAAKKYVINTAERVIKANYKLIGQVTVTDA